MDRKRKSTLFLTLYFCVLLIGILISCKETIIQDTKTEQSAIVTLLPEERPRLEDDFYAFVNFDMIQQATILPGEKKWGVINGLTTEIVDHLSAITEEIIRNKDSYWAGTPQQRISALYQSAIDMDSRNKVGITPIQPYLESIQNADTIEEYLSSIGTIEMDYGYSSLLDFYVDINMTDSSEYSLYLSGMDLGLGKEYLINESLSDYWKLYKDYIRQLFLLYGNSESEAVRKSEEIFRFQQDVAYSTLNVEELYSPDITYNPKNLKELQTLFSNVNVEAMLQAFGYSPSDGIKEWIVTDTKQIEKLNSYLTNEHLELLKDFSIFILLKDLAPNLSKDYYQANLDFIYDLYGIQEQKSAERIASELVQSILGFDFGKLYIEKYFSEKSKADIEALVQEIIEVYRGRIDKQEWMSKNTREKAKKKLDTMNVKIGYPDEWPVYMESAVLKAPWEGGSLLSNILEIKQINKQFEDSRLFNPVNRNEWFITPQTVNAYYNPSMNEIVFPAAILQPPFYDSDAERSANLGGIGMVIGHEITHAFDASGSLYDENGNYHVWWTEEEYRKFNELKHEIVNYYNSFELTDGLYVNGTLTLSENIADLGGLSCMCELCEQDQHSLAVMFENYANCWAMKQTRENMIDSINNDVHAPGKIRVNAVISSMDCYYDVFNIREGDGMYVDPENRVGLW